MKLSEAEEEKLQSIRSELEILDDPDADINYTLHHLYQLFSLYFELLTETVKISFTSLFSRMVYAMVRFSFESSLVRANHFFRKQFEGGHLDETEKAQLLEVGFRIMWRNISVLSGEEIPTKWSGDIAVPLGSEGLSSFYRTQRVLLTACGPMSASGLLLEYYAEDEPHIRSEGLLSEKEFAEQLKRFTQHVSFPIPASLVDVKISENRSEISAIVLQPDFLVGVTSISECFQAGGTMPIAALARKLIPTEPNKYLLMGNLVNYLFDELIHNPDLELKPLLREAFGKSAIDFALMADDDLREFLEKLQNHYTQLKRLVGHELEQTGISPGKAFLEPSFYSNTYGIQGRLDLYHYDIEKGQSDIVELKSGKLFRPNGYGLNENHYIQTLLYDLLLESVHKGKVKSNNYILYSSLESGNLKFAPKLRKRQYEALYLRNDIILMEELLAGEKSSLTDRLLQMLTPDRIPATFGFLARDARMFENVFRPLSPLEKSYYLHFISFISREYRLSKTGTHGVYSDNGLASLWLDPIEEKIDKFKILSHLEIEKNEAAEDNPRLYLTFSELSPRLSRFRKGDIAVLYPDMGGRMPMLSHQIFKCSILDIDSKGLMIRLRARQKNHEPFRKYRYWHLESDSLDSGFLKQFHGLFTFFQSSPDFRRKILGLEQPGGGQTTDVYDNSRLMAHQKTLVNKAIASKDYFLLWGPPGTGKTSVMLHAFVDYYYTHTDKNILLLAYTNKAVDEICASIDTLLDGKYLRIGSRYATDSEYEARLLNTVLETSESRKDVEAVIEGHRVFVSTISSFQGKANLLRLKKFDIAIIDEASQVLEPQLIGLLPAFEKFIMIGDHKQLPAVVAQDPVLCKTDDPNLIEKAGLIDMADSLFERLFRRCQAMSWKWAYGILNKQGRMHSDILNFISPVFYESRLEVMEGISRLTEKPQLKPFDSLSESLINQRLIFVNTPIGEAVTQKTNLLEAQLLKKVLDCWIEIYNYNSKDIQANTFGVITPFRSQIAIIRDLCKGEAYKQLSIDTVERYQGGSRDHIMISLAVSKAQLLDAISNISSEGIDRKLNVALTRARENVIIFGNAELLSQNDLYKQLIEQCYVLSHSSIK